MSALPDFEGMRLLYRDQLCDTPTCETWSKKPGRLESGYVLADAFAEHGYRTTASELTSFVKAADEAEQLKDEWRRTPLDYRSAFRETADADRDAWRAWQRLMDRVPAALLEIRLGGLALPLTKIMTGPFRGRLGRGGFDVKVYPPSGLGAPIATGWIKAGTSKGARFIAMRRFGVRSLRSP